MNFRENLSEVEVKQIVASLISNPFREMQTKYLDYLDQLLVVIHTHTPQLRKRTFENDVFLPASIGFRQWNLLPESLQKTPPPAFYSRDSDQYKSSMLKSFSKVFFPSDQCLLGISTLETNCCAWLRNDKFMLTVSQLEENNGMECYASFFCDEAQMSIEQSLHDDKQNNIISFTLPNDIVVQYDIVRKLLYLFCLSFQDKDNISKPSFLKKEKWRCIDFNGSVLIRYMNDSEKMYFASGEIWSRNHVTQTWVVVKPNGVTNDKTKNETPEQANIAVVTLIDPETRTRITNRDNLVISFEQPTGNICTQFSDYTRMFGIPHRVKSLSTLDNINILIRSCFVFFCVLNVSSEFSTMGSQSSIFMDVKDRDVSRIISTFSTRI